MQSVFMHTPARIESESEWSRRWCRVGLHLRVLKVDVHTHSVWAPPLRQRDAADRIVLSHLDPYREVMPLHISRQHQQSRDHDEEQRHLQQQQQRQRERSHSHPAPIDAESAPHCAVQACISSHLIASHLIAAPSTWQYRADIDIYSPSSFALPGMYTLSISMHTACSAAIVSIGCKKKHYYTVTIAQQNGR